MDEVGNTALLVSGIALLLLVAVAILAATKRTRLPFTVVLVVTGVLLAELARLFPEALEPIRHLELSPDLILFVFLPTLIFESALNLDVRHLRANIVAVLTLAIPGLLISTTVIGAIVHFGTGLSWPVSFLLGSILSAIDPVAVVATFRRLGAPVRLTVLVEGESLLNDATAIVLARILVVLVAGTTQEMSVLSGVVEFFRVFAGGVLVGWLMAMATGYLVGRVRADRYIEVTLTTILAYLSFLVAEEVFHVSGVMATVAAGLTLGSWGWLKISGPVREYMAHFWEYMAFVANALIFLMMGLQVLPADLLGVWQPLLWVIAAMLASRALIAFGLLPLASRGRVRGAYQGVVFWGGLRGAVSLALVLSLPAFPGSETVVSLVFGAVLFTLVVQGMTIDPLVRSLRLHRPPLFDRFARAEGWRAAAGAALKRLPDLRRGGQFSATVADTLTEEFEAERERAVTKLRRLKETELDADTARTVLYLRALAEEVTVVSAYHEHGHLSEQAARHLLATYHLQMDAIRAHGGHGTVRSHRLHRRQAYRLVIRAMQSVGGMANLSERLRRRMLALDYEIVWGRFQATTTILGRLDELASDLLFEQARREVEERYRRWRDKARRELDQTAEQFPEFVSAMQGRLGRRLVLRAERAELETRRAHGALPANVADEMIEEVDAELARLRGEDLETLDVAPEELLKKVPLFAMMPENRFRAIAERLRPHTLGAGEEVFRQGDTGRSLFMIARGVVRVLRHESGESAENELATLMAGDFFGEMALLRDAPRNATIRTVTPCALYELRRQDLEKLMSRYPAVRRALEEADARRSGTERGP